ncbi:MAG: hypothetical protein Q9182_006918 [Xanthomendoza sp. 2 TL-2023]
MTYDYAGSQIKILSATTNLKAPDMFGQDFAAERWTDKKIRQPLSLADIPDDQPTMTRKSFPANALNVKRRKDEAAPGFERNSDGVDSKRNFEHTFSLTDHLDTEHPRDVPWQTQPHLLVLLLVAEFRDSLDSFCPMGSTPRESI